MTRVRIPAHPDVYQHKKGGLYRVLHAAALDADDLKQLVVYLSLANGQTFVRPRSEWDEVVEWPDGEKRSRFVTVASLRAESDSKRSPQVG